jgi:hypothetical protein
VPGETFRFRQLRVVWTPPVGRSPAIIRLKQISFGSQLKAIATICSFTGLVIFALLVALDLAGIRVAADAPALPTP